MYSKSVTCIFAKSTDWTKIPILPQCDIFLFTQKIFQFGGLHVEYQIRFFTAQIQLCGVLLQVVLRPSIVCCYVYGFARFRYRVCYTSLSSLHFLLQKYYFCARLGFGKLLKMQLL